MFSKLLLASVATIGLLLAGPQRASAEVIYACVSTIGNIAIVASATAPCPPNVGSATWVKINWNVNSGGQATNVRYTPAMAIFYDGEERCTVTNVSAQPQTVTIEVFTRGGPPATSPFTTSLDPGTGSGIVIKQQGEFYCKFTVTTGTSSDIRGVLQLCPPLVGSVCDSIAAE